jgi:arogenate dehydrogenase (NADP+)
MNKDLKIGIIGLGLIGGSIFKALCKKGFDVIAVTRSDCTITKAKKYCMNVSNDLATLKPCDIIFVCTPMNKTVETLDKLENILKPNTIVTDASSLKTFVSKKSRPYNFIPSHPMAGTEFSGFDNSFETLFEGAKWVLTPIKKFEISDLLEIIKNLGAEPVFCGPNEHDRAVALISHMPMLIAQALFKSSEDNALALKLASSGFRDMTRLAMSNEEMASDMISMNAENIQDALLKLYSSVGELLNANYPEQIRTIKNNRSKMYKESGKNIL